MDPPLPKIKVVWIRGYEKIPFHRPKIWLPVGLPGAGKSSLLESLSLRHDKTIDLFGSRDNEALAWCRAPNYSSNEILFIKGDSVELSGKWDTVPISKITLGDIRTYRLSLSVHAFYGNYDEEFYGMNQILKQFWERVAWDKPWFLLVREAANWIYARIRLVKNQSLAKAQFIHTMRELRHGGTSIGADTIRWTSIDKEVRDVADYMFIKRVGVHGLPSDIRWLYRYISPRSLMNPPPSVFALISNKGPVGIGRFEEIPWHKQEKEDIMRIMGIKRAQGEIPKYAVGGRNIVSDFEHIDLIQLYLELSSMEKVAERLGRSSKTIHDHIWAHNEDVAQKGYCKRCRRGKGPHTEDRIPVGDD